MPHLLQVQGGRHFPQESTGFRVQGCLPRNIEEYVHRIHREDDTQDYQPAILQLRPYLHNRQCEK